MYRFLFFALIVMFLVLAFAGYTNRYELMRVAITMQLKPEAPFDAERVPEAPDYASLDAWAAHPGKDDPADQLPAGLAAPRNPAAAVFFVHPTTYIDKAGWNQALGDSAADWITDNRVLRNQASTFTGCCDVFAPRYRQATIFSFLDETGSGEQALDLAYEDVRVAFQQFRQTVGPRRPFILAGHSQGTLHAARLLREEIALSLAKRRLVAAYLVGFSITEGDLGGVGMCLDATDTGCVVGWNSVDGDNDGLYPGETDLICTNPLSWHVGAGRAGHELNLGGIGYPDWFPTEGEDPTSMVVEPGVVDAVCSEGRLVIDEIRSDAFPHRMPGPGESTHAYDYGFFWRNIFENARDRVDAFVGGP